VRIGVISDIHGNCVALDAALADMRKAGVKKVICLGDAIQGGPQPAETVQRLLELACPVVMGNADAWLLDEKGDTREETTTPQREVRSWTLSKLAPDDLSFIRTFRSTMTVPLGSGTSLFCFHGSPRSYDDVLLPETPNRTWRRLLGTADADLMAGGHTHAQQLRRVGRALFFNPGSIGLVYDVRPRRPQIRAYPWAEYVILSQERGRLGLEFRRAPYEVDLLARAVHKSGRPYGDTLVAEYKLRDE